VIAKLSGLVDQTGADWAIVDVGGVGYLVFASSRTLARLPPPGQPTSLLIETHVREDHIHLYGFADTASRDWFRLLITVQGVGTRVALAVQSALDADELLRAVASQDKASLARASGVGPKLAGRIVAELKDKVTAFTLAAGVAAAEGAAGLAAGPLADAISALVNLGYRRAEAYGAVAEAARRLGPDVAIDHLIRAGLKELSQ
jgi:Holliday junction DNA helicase RuvA